MKRRYGLRSTLTITTSAVAALALIAVGALFWLTTMLHRTTATVADSVESMYLLEEAEIELLLHARATAPLMARNLEASLRERLQTARKYANSREERHALEVATSRLDAYLARASKGAAPGPELEALQGEVYNALESVVGINVAQARAQRADAERWEQIASVVTLVLAPLLLASAALVVIWLKRRAFHPVFALAATMRRFGSGDRDARAQEIGPAELREMSATFNEMASALVLQREAQLATLAGVAHDLRQPLAALTLSTSMLDPEAMTAAQMRRPIEISRRQISRLERMIGDFLDMAKLNAERLELRLGTEDICTLVRNVVDAHDGTDARARIVLQLPDAPVPVPCDGLRIEQVVTNLVSNAIKYSPASAPIEVAVETRGDEVAISVTDHGPGLSTEEQAQLFEPFRRFGTAARDVPGIGLGLFVVRRILMAHGGRIEVQSEPRRGATFIAYLPLPR
jgi:two-component system, OmpR family, sensor histidine kinase MtrB